MKELLTSSTPSYQPRYFPELAIVKTAKSGTCSANRFRIAVIRNAFEGNPEIMRIHLLGFECRPATETDNRKMEACIRKFFRAFRADPKSSAHTLVTDDFGTSDKVWNKCTNGLMHKRKSSALRGHPVRTPPNTWNRVEPSPVPHENARMLVYKEITNLLRAMGTCKTSDTIWSH